MRKLLALVLILATIFCLSGCFGGDLAPGRNPTLNPFARYWGCIAIESYDQLQYAWSLRVNGDNDGVYEKTYVFDGGLGEGYRTVYYFSAPNAWITPTTDVDRYFDKIPDSVSVQSFIFYTANGYCNCSTDGNSQKHDLFMELPEEYIELQNYPYISITKSESLSDTEIIDVDDPSMISLSEALKTQGGWIYSFDYDGVGAFKIESCTELSETDLAELVEHIAVLK